MIHRHEIEKWSEQVARKFRPEKIIPFGSCARSAASEDSDLDMLVVMKRKRGQRDTRQAVAIRQRVIVPFPMDLLAPLPEEIEKAGLGRSIYFRHSAQGQVDLDRW